MASVRDLMASDLLTVEPSTGVEEAAARMDARHVGAAVVVDGERLAGIFTERDVLRAVARGAVAGSEVAEWMTKSPETIEPDDSTGHAAVLMIHGGFRHLPVVDGGKLVGIISIRDLIRVTLDDESPRGV